MDPFLLLHFDINRTLVLSDPAANATTHDLLNALCAEAAWGRIAVASTPGAPPSWHLATAVCSVVPPQDGLVSYINYLKKIAFPYRETAPTDTIEIAAKVDFNRAQKRSAQALVACFTDPGQPGETLRPLLELLRKHLEIPVDKRDACCSGPYVLPAWRQGRHFLFPAYFRLLESLLSSGRSFAIIFRTFGDDLADVIWEHNLWCSGQHPLHPMPAAVTPALAAQLTVRTPHDTARFVRSGGETLDSHLSTVLQREGPAGFYLVSAVSGFEAIHDHLSKAVGAATWRAACERSVGAVSSTRKPVIRALAIQDHYSYWFSQHEMGAAGKLLTVDPADPLLHPIFIDDNIGEYSDGERLVPAVKIAELAAVGVGVHSTDSPAPVMDDDTGIVDCRDLRSGRSLPLSAVRGIHLVRADALSAILHDGYFVEVVRLCEERRKVVLAAAARD